MIGRDQLGRMKQLMNNPADAAPVQRMAAIWATIEAEQTDSINDLADALGAGIKLEPVDREDRQAEITGLIGAMAPGGDDLADWWAEHRLDDLPDTAAEYVGMDPDDWAAMKDDVPEQYHDPIESRAVGIGPKDILRSGMAGRLEAIDDAIQAATEHVDADE